MRLTLVEHGPYVKDALIRGESYRTIANALGCNKETVNLFARINFPELRRVQQHVPAALPALSCIPTTPMPDVRWHRVTKFDKQAVTLADRHYSRRTPGSPQFMPPGQTLCLLTGDGSAVWGWWRPHPSSGITAMNKLDGWTCTIFRNESSSLSSDLVLAAEMALVESGHGCGPDGMLTYVWDKRVRSRNPGYCYKLAGWEVRGRSADNRKTLLSKPFALAGIAA